MTMGVEQVQEGGFILCPAGHKNARGIEQCAICSLPMLDFSEELEGSLSLLAEAKRALSGSKRRLSLGLGSGGSKGLLSLLSSSAKKISSPHFLVVGVEESELARFREWMSKNQPDYDLQRLLRSTQYKLRSPIDKSGGVWGNVEHLAISDAELEDKLRRIGLSENVEDQLTLMMGHLGDGISSGMGPYMLRRMKQINTGLSGIAIVTLPSTEDIDQMHFNAYCGLSRFVRYGIKLVDMIIPMDGDAVKKMIGIDRSGKILGPDMLIPRMLRLFSGLEDEILTEMARLARSYRVQVFSPIYAYGRSYEIYEKMGNILEHAANFPLAPFDPESVALSIAIAQVPEKIAAKGGARALEEQFNAWSRARFPNTRDTLLKIVQVKETSDRLDVILLLGGSSLGAIASPLKDGYERFRTYVDRLSLWDEYDLTKEELKRVESMIDAYDKSMGQLMKRAD